MKSTVETSRDSTLRLVDAMRVPRNPDAPVLDELTISKTLDSMDEELVLSVIPIIEHGNDYESMVLRGRIIGLSRVNSSFTPEERARRRIEEGIESKQEMKLRRVVAGILTYRDFCDPRHQNRHWLQEYLTELESDIREKKFSDEYATSVAPALAFVQCIDFNAVPDEQTATWIMEHLDTLRPHAELLRERRDWSIGFLEEIVNAKSFALVDGIL